jgi:hypothetical protein
VLLSIHSLTSSELANTFTLTKKYLDHHPHNQPRSGVLLVASPSLTSTSNSVASFTSPLSPLRFPRPHSSVCFPRQPPRITRVTPLFSSPNHFHFGSNPLRRQHRGPNWKCASPPPCAGTLTRSGFSRSGHSLHLACGLHGQLVCGHHGPAALSSDPRCRRRQQRVGRRTTRATLSGRTATVSYDARAFEAGPLVTCTPLLVLSSPPSSQGAAFPMSPVGRSLPHLAPGRRARQFLKRRRRPTSRHATTKSQHRVFVSPCHSFPCSLCSCVAPFSQPAIYTHRDHPPRDTRPTRAPIHTPSRTGRHSLDCFCHNRVQRQRHHHPRFPRLPVTTLVDTGCSRSLFDTTAFQRSTSCRSKPSCAAKLQCVSAAPSGSAVHGIPDMPPPQRDPHHGGASAE